MPVSCGTDPFPYDLLARVAEVWQQALAEQPAGLAYLESRGIRDKNLLGQIQAGYCDGDKLLAITTTAERELLQRAGVINEGGKEFFSRCVVFPLKDRQGRVVGFYGRSTLPRAKVPHRCCGPVQTGLFAMEAARGAQSVFLVEGILDALALMQAGVPNVIALGGTLGGTQGFSGALLGHLQAEKVQELVLCLDGDEAGQQGAVALQDRLEKEGFAVRTVALPEGQDPLSFATRVSNPELKASLFPAAPGQVYRKLSMAQGKLKVFVSLTNAEGVKADTTVDLFSTRSRQTEAAQLARRLGVESGLLEEWFLQVLQEIEEMRKGDESAQELFAKVEVPPMTAQQRKEALQFLTQKNLVEVILQDMEALGYVGEEEAKLLGYCVSVSRKLERPMSAIIQSGSGAGKSYLAEVIRTLSPPEDVVFYSRLSPQALYHMPKDYLVHKLL